MCKNFLYEFMLVILLTINSLDNSLRLHYLFPRYYLAPFDVLQPLRESRFHLNTASEPLHFEI